MVEDNIIHTINELALHQKQLESIKRQLKKNVIPDLITEPELELEPEPMTVPEHVPEQSVNHEVTPQPCVLFETPNPKFINNLKLLDKPLGSITTASDLLDYDSVFNSTSNLSRRKYIVNVPQNHNIQHHEPINRLEPLVDFTLRYRNDLNPQHLTNRTRQVGYRDAFNSLSIKSKPITDNIDKYLKSLRISGLNWKSLGVKPDTIFPNIVTKYDHI